jgi:hypothetical protein
MCENLRSNLGWYQLYSNLFRGGRYIFTPPQGTVHPVTRENVITYLVQHEAEPDGEFYARVRDSFTLPYCREIVTIFTSTLFRQDVIRDPIVSLLGRGIVRDIDLRGHSAREFLRRAFSLAQVFGWIGVLTDYPRKSGAYLSDYHERSSGDRPYSRFVLPSRLWNWKRDPATGDFLFAEIWNGENGEKALWRRWYETYWIDVNRDGHPIDGGEHTFGKVPLDILVCQSIEADDGMEPFGQSALVDIANIALHIYQMCSLLEAHERRALFAFLHIGEDPAIFKDSSAAQAPDLHLGSSHYLWSSGDVKWVEPPDSVPKEAREQISWAVQEMRRAAGVSTRSEESVEAHSGVALSWEYSSRHNAVYERAQNLEDFESSLWQTHGRILGVDVPGDLIRYPREYAIQPIEQELTEIERLTEISGKWSGAKEALLPLVQLKLRRIAIRDVGHLPVIDEILNAIDVSMSPAEPLPGSIRWSRIKLVERQAEELKIAQAESQKLEDKTQAETEKLQAETDMLEGDVSSEEE